MATTALITGANKGIGFEVARLLGERGITAIVGARDQGRGEAAAAKLGLPFVRLDVTGPATAKAAAAWIEREYGRLDILVNNAGIVDLPPLPPSSTSLEALRRVYETNVFGVVTVTNAMLPLLRRSPAGRIVNQSSELGSKARMLDPASPAWPLNNLPYQSSKSALNMVTVAYAKELWDTPVKVNACDPGWCDTDASGHQGFKTAAEGAEIAVRLATLGEDAPTGGFFHDDGPLPW
ncbi:MAG: SDR family oxidoreductase [Actinobacteria bacterium]|nr:SDR family oxidoreductase [Actinomycetota bacterium]MBO0813784.1 SDR family oxidoreductase [Actinomycetota bacterium]